MSIFLRANVTSVFFDPRTLGCQSPGSRLLSPAAKVLSPPETILKSAVESPQSLLSSDVVHPHHIGRPFELIDIFQSQKKDCQIFLGDLHPDTDFSGTGREGFP